MANILIKEAIAQHGDRKNLGYWKNYFYASKVPCAPEQTKHFLTLNHIPHQKALWPSQYRVAALQNGFQSV